MVVKLRVMHGPSAGKEIKIPDNQFVIGRGDDCHLRPKSDAVSRQHCIIVVNDSQVLVRDMQSKNGTYVNGDRVEGDRIVKVGDHLKVGPLEFEMVIDYGLAGDKRPSVTTVQEAAARTFDASVLDTDVSSWLEESDTKDKAQRAADPETRQFRMNASETDPSSESAIMDTTSNVRADEATTVISTGATDKKVPGKLPKRPDSTSANSRDAASEMLKKFFNRR